MGADRFIHKRAGSGDRVNQLGNLEFRLWIFYELGADDFGVLRYDVASFIEAHAYFGRREKPAALRTALDRMVETMRLTRFTAHGLEYLCQSDWQDFQKGEWAQMTTRPKPADDLVATFTPWTQILFAVWPGQSRIPPNPDATKRRRQSGGRNNYGSDSNSDPGRYSVKPPGSVDRGNVPVNGSGFRMEESARETDNYDDTARFIEGYRERYQRITGGTFPLVHSPKDVALVNEMLRTWPLPRLLDMAELFLLRDDRDVTSKPRTIPFFKGQAPWCDTRLREAGR